MIRPRRSHEISNPHLTISWPLPFYREVRIGLAWPEQLRKLFLELKPDLIHIATPGPLGFFAIASGRRLSVPVVSSYHTNFDGYLKHYAADFLQPGLVAYLRYLHNRTAVTFVPSESTRLHLQNRGFRHLEIWSRGIDSQMFNPRFRDVALRRSLGLGESDVLLLYVGRLAHEKGLPDLLNAYTRLHGRSSREGNKLCLALVGGGPLATRMKDSPAAAVHLAGYQDGELLARWFASADIFAFPSRSETFGNVVLEAQASGLPVLGFDCPTMRERVTPKIDGLLVTNVDEFVDGLDQLTKAPAFRKRLGEAGRIRAATQDWDAIFDRLESRYRDLAGVQ